MSFSSNNGKVSKHDHGHWEVGVAGGSVLLLQEDELALGLHFHFLRRLEKFEKLSVGLGLESVLDEHTHFNTAIVFKYDVWKGFSSLVSPGLLFLKHETSWDAQFSAHFEVLYEFKLGEFHVGPVLEYSHSKNDNHLMLGLHLGYSF